MTTTEQLHQLYSKYYLVDTDTRSIRKNALYFALKGTNFNGNTFASEALKNGASYAVVDEKEYQTSDKILLVDDVLKSLQNLATYHREKLGIPIISLTGSNGKTTTKELVNAVLNTKYKATATKGNLNNHIGVPLTLLTMTPKTEIGIVEMGANHLHEIEFLCTIAKPDYGYITNFGKAHLEGFKSIEGVIKGKSELYNYLKAHNKTAFINGNDTLQLKQVKGVKKVPFHSSIKIIDANPFVRLVFENIEIQSQLIGEYNFTNIAAAITIGNYFKIDSEYIKTAIENYVSTNNRSQIIIKKTSKILLDAYNANPSSMELALNNFNKLQENNKIVVLGDMFELGKFSKIEHQNIAEIVEKMGFNSVYLIGKNFSQTSIKKASKFESFSDFIETVNLTSFKDSTILIKGSRGITLEKLLDFL